jgi:transposase
MTLSERVKSPRGVRCVGIFRVLQSGDPSRDLPETYGRAPLAIIASFVGGRRRVWDPIMDALVGHHAPCK